MQMQKNRVVRLGCGAVRFTVKVLNLTQNFAQSR